MNGCLLAAGILVLVFAILGALCIVTTPEGWQDRDGFHFGVQPRPKG